MLEPIITTSLFCPTEFQIKDVTQSRVSIKHRTLTYGCRFLKCLGSIFYALLLLLQPVGRALLVAREFPPDVDAGNATPIEMRDLGGLSLEQVGKIQARAVECTPASYSPVYIQGDPGQGLGGFDLKSSADRIFTFDYDHSGKQDHLVMYRPGTGAFRIVTLRDGSFVARYAQSQFGIGGYNMNSPADRAFAFDFDHSGKLDHIVLYRPGTGTIWILKNDRGFFTPVYRTPDSGIGGYDLKSTADRALAFDYEHSGKQDYLVFYRPGTGIIWILNNLNGVFSSVRNGTRGIGGYDLKSANDLIFAYDYDSIGKLDYLVLYRPGTGTVWILRNLAGVFAAVFLQGDPGMGIGGFDILSIADRAFAYDFANTGRFDHIVFWRPGSGIFFILHNNGGQFTAVFQDGISGKGIGGYDMLSPADQILAYDYGSKGASNYLLCFRPGTGAAWILRKS